MQGVIDRDADRDGGGHGGADVERYPGVAHEPEQHDDREDVRHGGQQADPQVGEQEADDQHEEHQDHQHRLQLPGDHAVGGGQGQYGVAGDLGPEPRVELAVEVCLQRLQQFAHLGSRQAGVAHLDPGTAVVLRDVAGDPVMVEKQHQLGDLFVAGRYTGRLALEQRAIEQHQVVGEGGHRQRGVQALNEPLHLDQLVEVAAVQEGVLDAGLDHHRERFQAGKALVQPGDVPADLGLCTQAVGRVVVDLDPGNPVGRDHDQQQGQAERLPAVAIEETPVPRRCLEHAVLEQATAAVDLPVPDQGQGGRDEHDGDDEVEQEPGRGHQAELAQHLDAAQADREKAGVGGYEGQQHGPAHLARHVAQGDLGGVAAALAVAEFRKQVDVLGRTDHDQQDRYRGCHHVDGYLEQAHQAEGPQDADAGGDQGGDDVEQLPQQQEQGDQQCADGQRHQVRLLGHDAARQLAAYLGEADRVDPLVDAGERGYGLLDQPTHLGVVGAGAVRPQHDGHRDGAAVGRHQQVADQRVLQRIGIQGRPGLGRVGKLGQVGLLVEVAVHPADVRHAEQALGAVHEGQSAQRLDHRLQCRQAPGLERLGVLEHQHDHPLLAEDLANLLVVGPLRVVDDQHLVGGDPDLQPAQLGRGEQRRQQQPGQGGPRVACEQEQELFHRRIPSANHLF